MRGGIAGALGVVLAGLSVAAPASAELAPEKPLAYTGAQQTYTVPGGVTWLAITAAGAPGWDTTTNQTGSVGDNNDGYEVYGMLAVTPGEPLYAEVGQAGLASGAATFGGGGAGGTASLAHGASGGGASDVRTCSILGACPGGGGSLSSRLIVGAGGGGSGGTTLEAGSPAFADGLNSLGGDGCTEGQTLHSCATESVASGTVIEGGEAYGGNTLSGYTPASGGTDTGGAGSILPNSTLTYVEEEGCQMSGSVTGATGQFGVGGDGGSGNQNGGGGGGGGYFGGGGGGSGRVAGSGTCSSPPPTGVGVGGGTGSSFLSVALLNTSFEGDEDNSGTETTAGITFQPLVELTSPANSGFYTKGQVVRASYDCYYAAYSAQYCQGSELGPGATSSTSVASGAPIDTSTLGKHTFTVFNDWASGPSRVATTVSYTVSEPSGGGLTKGSSSISGATGKHPKLTVKVSAPHGESISKVSIHPPSGFAFIGSQLRHGVSATGATRELVSHGSLVVLLKHSVSSVSVKVSDGALRLSGKAIKKVKKGKLKSVIFTVDASLSTGSIAQLSLTTRL
jgi:hypothetical protein